MLQMNGECNNDVNHHSNSGNGNSHGADENMEPSSKRRKLLRSSLDDDGPKTLTAEMTVYDRHSRCLLTEGEYELILSEEEENKLSAKTGNGALGAPYGGGNASGPSSRKNAAWENVSFEKNDKVNVS